MLRQVGVVVLFFRGVEYEQELQNAIVRASDSCGNGRAEVHSAVSLTAILAERRPRPNDFAVGLLWHARGLVLDLLLGNLKVSFWLRELVQFQQSRCRHVAPSAGRRRGFEHRGAPRAAERRDVVAVVQLGPQGELLEAAAEFRGAAGAARQRRGDAGALGPASNGDGAPVLNGPDLVVARPFHQRGRRPVQRFQRAALVGQRIPSLGLPGLPDGLGNHVPVLQKSHLHRASRLADAGAPSRSEAEQRQRPD
mmetsp:Transcript_39132/g.113047  ORF Transcript_39132/g.113047 Transcript_39132/m.113047 type:complete len:252 (+) Transcript_39132:222-977(+)